MASTHAIPNILDFHSVLNFCLFKRDLTFEHFFKPQSPPTIGASHCPTKPSVRSQNCFSLVWEARSLLGPEEPQADRCLQSLTTRGLRCPRGPNALSSALQVGVVQYGEDAVHEFHLNDYRSVRDVVEAASHIEQRGGTETRTAFGIEFAR